MLVPSDVKVRFLHVERQGMRIRGGCLCAVLLLALIPAASYSQVAEKKDPVQEKLLQDAAQKGLPLTASTAVNSSISIEAVLLPPIVTRHVFSKAISDRFAAVELTISNRSHDAALVVHSIFIDY